MVLSTSTTSSLQTVRLGSTYSVWYSSGTSNTGLVLRSTTLQGEISLYRLE
jgi:hypothetical protein